MLCACGQPIPPTRTKRGNRSTRCPDCREKHKHQLSTERGRRWRAAHPEQARAHNRKARQRRTQEDNGEADPRDEFNRELDALPVTVIDSPDPCLRPGAKFNAIDLTLTNRIRSGIPALDWVPVNLIFDYRGRSYYINKNHATQPYTEGQ
jgi:hypothetical protein